MFLRAGFLAILACQYVSATAAEPVRCVGHTRMVTSVAFTPDGKKVVSGAEDGTVRVWDATNGKQIREIVAAVPKKYEKYGVALKSALTPDGKEVAVCSWDQPINFWDIATGKQQKESYPVEGSAFGLAFSPDGSKLAIAEKEEVSVWRRAADKKLWYFELDKKEIERAENVAFSPDGSLVAASEMPTGNSPYAKIPKVRIWKYGAQEEVFSTWPFPSRPGGISFSPDGKLFAVGGGNGREGVLQIWDLDSKKMVKEIAADERGISSLAFAPTAKMLATGGADSNVKIWDVETGHLNGILKTHDGSLALCFSDNGRKIASAGYDRLVLIWNLDIDLMKPDSKKNAP